MESAMKQGLRMLAAASLVGVLAGCGAGAEEAELKRTSPSMVETMREAAAAEKDAASDASGKPDAAKKAGVVRLADAAVTQETGADKAKMWSIEATVHNDTSQPLAGVEVVADLREKGAEQSFHRASSEVRFETPLAPGASLALSVTAPVLADAPKEVEVQIELLRRLEPPAPSEDAWKPLDPATAEKRQVGEAIVWPKSASETVTASPTS